MSMSITQLCLLVAVLCTVAAGENVHTLHVVAANHLDVGFDGIDPVPGFAANVLDRYFNVYLPAAAATAAELRAANASVGAPRLIYTTHAFVLSAFFDCAAARLPTVPRWHAIARCPNATARALVARAVNRRDIVWHAMPFNAEPGASTHCVFCFFIMLVCLFACYLFRFVVVDYAFLRPTALACLVQFFFV